MATKKQKTNYCILCNDGYGIYYGDVLSFDPLTGVAIVAQCRHVARWFGHTGGITSLAVYGLCGPKADESLIGAPTSSPATLTHIRNVFPASDVAAETFKRSTTHV